jgi:hypothetical protein
MNRTATRLTVAITAAALGALAIHTNIASACGSYGMSDEVQVQWAVEDHLAAVKSGDQALFNAVWADSGKHVKMVASAEVGHTIESEPIKTAFSRWAKTPDPKMASKIQMLDIVDEQMAFAKVDVTWHGSTYTEYLTLFKINGQWKLVEKMHVGERTAPKTKTKVVVPGY